MDIRSLEDLLAPDERTLRFAPGGFLTASQLTPHAAAEHQQRTIAAADLVDAVPEIVRGSFERLRHCHSLGVIWYEAFTLAADLSYVVLELALRERFVEFYAGTLSFVTKEGPAVLHVRDFDDLSFQIRNDKRTKNWKLVTRADGWPTQAPLTLNPLLLWARHEGLLGGQRNRHIEAVLPKIRNDFAHGSHRTGMPNESAREIRDLAEIINRLWGHSTPGGRLHPAPQAREAIVVGWRGLDAVDRHIRFSAHRLGLGMPEEPGVWTYLVLLAVPRDESLLAFDNRYESTSYPSELLWGPGTYEEARGWWKGAKVPRDEVQHQDRMFALRVVDDHVHLPRTPGGVASLPTEERTGTWHVVCADHPDDALQHVRHIPGGAEEPCVCAVQCVATGSWAEVLPMLASGAPGADADGRGPVRVPQFGQPAR
ncbi:MAG: hypothetical protein M3O32_00665 [Actinomycetota bacterium]|nr:hypothetical protein [Actinomycetota bacterium]